jgi:hypothetical protein
VLCICRRAVATGLYERLFSRVSGKAELNREKCELGIETGFLPGTINF